MATTIFLDQAIGSEPNERSAGWLRSQLPTDGSDIVVRFHSEGGDLFQAFQMLDELRAYKGRKTAVVSSMAFSAASMLLMVFDEIQMTPTSYLMLHDPRSGADEPTLSEQKLLGSLSTRMEEVYAARSGQSRGTIRRLMEDETFLDASTAVRLRFADRITETIAARSTYRIAASGHTAMAKWKSAIASTGLPHAKAVLKIEKEQPQLRQQVIAEANATRRRR